jgi:amidase
MPGDMSALSESTLPDLYESGISNLQKGLEKGQFTSVDLVKVIL